MANLSEIVKYCDDLLDAGSIKDSCPNGLQVEGKSEVKYIVTGVSACVELFEEAVKRKADAILVHHGMFWDSDPKPVKGSLKARLKILLDNDISLLGYHLPLDRSYEVGNNIQIVNRLGLIEPKPFGAYEGQNISYMARTSGSVSIADFIQTIRKVVGRDVKHYSFGPDEINLVSVCSGSAPGLVREAIEKKADLFITGEDAEWVYHLSKEEGIHYVAAGHHATERFGVMALGDRVKEKFGIEVEFVDIPNPI